MNPTNSRQANKSVVPAAISHRDTPACRHQLGRITFALCYVLLVLSAFGSNVVAQTSGQTAAANNEPSRQPILRIETGMHTAAIKRISVDAAGRYLATGSEDKTVRVWELATGRLLRVLRPPLGAGDQGKILAVALSPDGRLVAVGGRASNESNTADSIYLFDRESGRLVRRLGGLPNIALHLAFSPDGIGLAAALGEGGIRVFRVADGTEIRRDAEYDAESYSLDFDRTGRLVTSCLDGYLRLYDRSLKLLKKVRALGGQYPFAVRFAPDGATIAVGYGDSTRVDVLEGNSLRKLYQPDTAGVNNGNLTQVAWSSDGAALYAGGEWVGETGIFLIRRWADAGRGQYQNLAAASNTIFGLAPLADGSMVFGTSNPAWGVFSASSQRTRLVTGEITDYRGLLASFLTDTMGGIVGFTYEAYGKSPAQFVLTERRLASLETGTSASVALQPPRNNDMPKFDEVKHALKQNEIPRSIAIAPDERRFLLGTEFYLHLFERNGKEQWQVEIPSVAWGVNISGNGKLAVAAFGDGTIRWYRMTDGKELLAFFPHNDRKRWVLWTPQGYYDASPGADELIGWHVNNGKDAAADFYPISRFFEQYYRPDVITEVIRSVQTDQEVIARLGASGKLNIAAGIKRPPKVSFVSPRVGEQFDREEVEIAVSAQDLGGGVDELRLFHNGKLISGTERGQGVVKPAGKSVQRTFAAQLVEGENRFVAVALSQERVESEPAELGVTLRGVTQEVDLHLLVIGINRYRNAALNLNYAEADAQGIASFFDSTQSKRLFRQVQIHRLLNEQATLQGIQQAFNQIKAQARPQDTVVIYLAGHGDVAENEWYFVPHDLVTPETESDLKKGGLSRVMLEEIVKSVQARKFFMMLDACKSGGAVMAMRGYEERKALAQLARSTGIYVVSATTDKQLAAEMSELGHGVFTYVLLEGLKGKAGAPKITVEGLIQYVKDKLPDLTEKYRGAPQYPVSWTLRGMDFPLVLQGEGKK